MIAVGRKPRAAILSMMKLAAELKALGHRWNTIARQLHRNERTLRRWQENYPEVWDRLLANACSELYQRIANTPLALLAKERPRKNQLQEALINQSLFGQWIKLQMVKMRHGSPARSRPNYESAFPFAPNGAPPWERPDGMADGGPAASANEPAPAEENGSMPTPNAEPLVP